MDRHDLLDWRTRRGWSQRQLAATLGISHPTVGRWERGALAMPAWLPRTLRDIDTHPTPDEKLD